MNKEEFMEKNKFDELSFDELSELVEEKKEEIEELEIKIDLSDNKQARFRRFRLQEELKILVYRLGKLEMDRLNEKKEENKRMKKNEEMILERRTMEYGIEDIIRGTEVRGLMTTTDGAAIIPENVENSIALKMEEVSPVFEKVRKLHTDSGEIKVVRENDSIKVGFVGEGENVIEESLKFDFVKLQQKRVGGAITLSSQLLNDSSIDLEDYVGNLLARRTARAIEKSIFVGNTENEFNGIIHDEFINNVEIIGDTITMDNLQDMYLSIHPEFLKGAGFVMQRDFFNKIAKMKDGQGNYLMQNGVVNGKITYTLFGMPVDITESLPAENPVLFGNLEEGVSMMVKRGAQLQKIASDTQQSLRGSVLFVYDFYADSSVVNPQAISKLTITP